MGTELKKKIAKVDEIKPMKDNAKKHPSWQIEKLVQSINQSRVKEPELLQPIVVDENNVIIMGHGRLQAVKELGWQRVEVIVRDGLTNDQKKALAILDNKSVSLEWDEDILAKELPKLADAALETGFSEKEIKDLIAKSTKVDVDIDTPAFELTPRLYEKHNYILLHFDNEIDFLQASQMMGLKKMADRMKPQKVGLFRAIKGNEAIKKIKEAKSVEVPYTK